MTGTPSPSATAQRDDVSRSGGPTAEATAANLRRALDLLDSLPGLPAPLVYADHDSVRVQVTYDSGNERERMTAVARLCALLGLTPGLNTDVQHYRARGVVAGTAWWVYTPLDATRRDRYARCDDTCTTDCGACKGRGRPNRQTHKGNAPEDVASDDDLPGMWEKADFTGGIDEIRGPGWPRPCACADDEAATLHTCADLWNRPITRTAMATQPTDAEVEAKARELAEADGWHWLSLGDDGGRLGRSGWRAQARAALTSAGDKPEVMSS